MNKYKKGPSTNLMTPKMVTIPPPPLLLERENTTRFFKYNCTNMFIQFFTYISLSLTYLIDQYELSASKKTKVWSNN